jgi:hypothetical protein
MGISSNESLRWIASVALLCLIAGCGSPPKQSGDAQPPVSERNPVIEVDVRLAEEAARNLEQQAKGFDADALAAVIRNRLTDSGFFVEGVDGPGVRAEIVVTKVRLRSTVAAAVLGVLAGLDEVSGDVRLLSNGRPGDEFKFEIGGRYGLGQSPMHAAVATRLQAIYDDLSEQFVDRSSGLPRCLPPSSTDYGFPWSRDASSIEGKCRKK